MMFQKKADPEINFRMKEYKIPSKITLPNFSAPELENIRGETFSKKDSVAKLLKYTERENSFNLKVFLKDDTLIRKVDLILEKNDKNKWEIEIPEELFRTCALKSFVNKLKTLNK